MIMEVSVVMPLVACCPTPNAPLEMGAGGGGGATGGRPK